MSINEFIMRFNAPEGCTFKSCETCGKPFVYDERIDVKECVWCACKLQEIFDERT